jgi:acetyl esterase/lipase
MMERQYPLELLEEISRRQYTINEQGLEILVKPIPDDDRPGAMDARLLALTKPLVSGITGLIISFLLPGIMKSRNPRRLASAMRRYFNDIMSLPITQNVTLQHEKLRAGTVEIPVRIYHRNNAKSGVPVLLYMHGGGFAAGTPDIVEELVKQVVSLSGCVAVQIDYRLAPENPYPAAHEDCWEMLKWVHANAASLGGDSRRIYVAGDSAGGNLANACAMRDRDEKRGMVKAQILLYPVINMAGKEDAYYHYSLDQFQMLEEHRKSIVFRITSMRAASEGVLGCVLGVKDESIPALSPYLYDLRGMPPTLLLCGAFDCLCLDGEAYARKLKMADVPVRVIRYLGVGHAFAEWVGVQPQADDCAAEIANFILRSS